MPRTYNISDVDRGLAKLERLNRRDPGQGLVISQDGEMWGYYWIDGKRQFHVSAKRPRQGDLGKGRAVSLRKQLKLSEQAFADLCDCPLSGENYHELMRRTLG